MTDTTPANTTKAAAAAGRLDQPVKPRCFDAAMDGVSQYEEREIRAYIKRLETWAESTAAAERERWRTAARLVLEAEPDQMPLALDALRDVYEA